MSYVLTHTDEYQKDEASRKALSKFIGAGVLVAEGM